MKLILEVHQQPHELTSMGVDLDFSPDELKSDGRVARAAQQDDLCNQAFVFASSLVGARLKRHLNFLCGWPVRGVLIGDRGNMVAARKAVQELKEAHPNFVALVEKREKRRPCSTGRSSRCGPSSKWSKS